MIDFTNLINNLTTDEVIIIDSHDDIFNGYQIHFWRKDKISDILPAIKCPSFKSETKIFKVSEMEEFWNFIDAQNHIKSIVIENVGKELSINLIYGNTIKTGPWTFCSYQQTKFLDKLQERYEHWEIDDCSCKPKKIRVWADNFQNLKHTIEELERISSTNDTKFGMHIDKKYNQPFFDYDTMVFNNSARWKSEKTSKFIFTGDSLTVVSEGNSYDFKLDETIKKSTNSEIRGKIINYNSKNYFALNVDRIYDLNFILKDEEVKNPENKEFIDDLKECSKYTEDCLIIFDQKDITLKIYMDKVKKYMPEQEFYSKVNVRIDFIESENIIKMLKHIPNYLTIRLEADYIYKIIEPMKSKIIIEKLKKLGTKFLHKGIEIEPRIIKSKQDEDDFIDEIGAKICQLNIDCDK